MSVFGSSGLPHAHASANSQQYNIIWPCSTGMCLWLVGYYVTVHLPSNLRPSPYMVRCCQHSSSSQITSTLTTNHMLLHQRQIHWLKSKVLVYIGVYTNKFLHMAAWATRHPQEENKTWRAQRRGKKGLWTSICYYGVDHLGLCDLQMRSGQSRLVSHRVGGQQGNSGGATLRRGPMTLAEETQPTPLA